MVGEVQLAVIMVVTIMVAVMAWATSGFSLAAVDVAVEVSVGPDVANGGEDGLVGEGSSVLPSEKLDVAVDAVPKLVPMISETVVEV
jgi:hypothetical protein